MLDPTKRFISFVLALGVIVLAASIALGERMGDTVIGQVTEKRLTSIAPVTVTPAPAQSSGPYGPDWKRTQVLAAASDPGFPDPRVPPATLPPVQAARGSRPAQSPSPSPTPNLNLPIWRRNAPLPTASAMATGSPEPSPSPSASPVAATATPPQPSERSSPRP